MMTVLYVAIPLFIVNIWVPLGGWMGGILIGAFVALAVLLSVFSVYETRSLRRLAKEL